MSTMNITIIIPALQIPTKHQQQQHPHHHHHHQQSSDSPQPTTPFPPINLSPSPTPSLSSMYTPTSMVGVQESSSYQEPSSYHQHAPPPPPDITIINTPGDSVSNRASRASRSESTPKLSHMMVRQENTLHGDMDNHNHNHDGEDDDEDQYEDYEEDTFLPPSATPDSEMPVPENHELPAEINIETKTMRADSRNQGSSSSSSRNESRTYDTITTNNTSNSNTTTTSTKTTNVTSSTLSSTSVMEEQRNDISSSLSVENSEATSSLDTAPTTENSSPDTVIHILNKTNNNHSESESEPNKDMVSNENNVDENNQDNTENRPFSTTSFSSQASQLIENEIEVLNNQEEEQEEELIVEIIRGSEHLSRSPPPAPPFEAEQSETPVPSTSSTPIIEPKEEQEQTERVSSAASAASVMSVKQQHGLVRQYSVEVSETPSFCSEQGQEEYEIDEKESIIKAKSISVTKSSPPPPPPFSPQEQRPDSSSSAKGQTVEDDEDDDNNDDEVEQSIEESLTSAINTLNSTATTMDSTISTATISNSISTNISNIPPTIITTPASARGEREKSVDQDLNTTTTKNTVLDSQDDEKVMTDEKIDNLDYKMSSTEQQPVVDSQSTSISHNSTSSIIDEALGTLEHQEKEKAQDATATANEMTASNTETEAQEPQKPIVPKKRIKSVRKIKPRVFPNPRKPSNYPQRTNKVTLARQALAREKRRVYVEERIQSYIKNAQANNMPLPPISHSTPFSIESTHASGTTTTTGHHHQNQSETTTNNRISRRNPRNIGIIKQNSTFTDNDNNDTNDTPQETNASNNEDTDELTQPSMSSTYSSTQTRKQHKHQQQQQQQSPQQQPQSQQSEEKPQRRSTTPTLNELQSQLRNHKIGSSNNPLPTIIDSNNYYLNNPITLPPPPKNLSAISVARVHSHHRRAPFKSPNPSPFMNPQHQPHPSSMILPIMGLSMPEISFQCGSETVKHSLFATPSSKNNTGVDPITEEQSSSSSSKSWKGVEHHGYFYSFRVRQSGPVQMMDKGVQTGSRQGSASINHGRTSESHQQQASHNNNVNNANMNTQYTTPSSFSQTHSSESFIVCSNNVTNESNFTSTTTTTITGQNGQENQEVINNPQQVADERDKILREIAETVQLRHDAELRRADLVQRANDLQTRVKEKRDKINRRHEFWHKKYIEESSLTRPLEASCTSLRAELNTVHRRLLAHLEGRDLPLRLRDGPSKKANYKIMAARLQHEIKELQQKVKAAKLKLDSEIKLKEQADREVREIRNDLSHKKVVMSLARSQVSTLPAVHARSYESLVY